MLQYKDLRILDAWLRPSRTSQPDTRTIIKYSRRVDTNRDLAPTRQQRQIAAHQARIEFCSGAEELAGAFIERHVTKPGGGRAG